MRDFRYHLLSIGVNRESNGASIRSAERDAFGVSWTFAQLGYWRPDRNRCLTGSQSTPAAIAAHLDHCATLAGLDFLCLFWSGHLVAATAVIDALARTADVRQRVVVVDTCCGETEVAAMEAQIAALPEASRPVLLASSARDGRSRENSLHGFFTGALLRQLRRPRRPGARSLDLVDVFNRAADDAVGRTGCEPLFAANGKGRMRIPILAQTDLPFEA
jgi:hypothetical protein